MYVKEPPYKFAMIATNKLNAITPKPVSLLFYINKSTPYILVVPIFNPMYLG